MNRIILTHVGVSVLLTPTFVEFYTSDTMDLQQKLQRDYVSPDDLDICFRDLRDGLETTWSPDYTPHPHEWRQRSPAEIAALSLLKLQSDDTVVLLHSQTKAGEFCAKLIAEALQIDTIPPNRTYPHCTASQLRLEPLKGVKITDDGENNFDRRDAFSPQTLLETLVHTGLVSYVSFVWDRYQELIDQGGGELIFNITSGYRGLTPIARDLALLLEGYARGNSQPVRCRMVYLFQRGESLIRYDPLPMAINWRLLPKWEVLDEASRKPGVVPTRYEAAEAAYFADVEGDLKHQRLSPLGAVVYALMPKLKLP
jgi:hypothetical protein